MAAQHEYVMMDPLVALAGLKKSTQSRSFTKRMLLLCHTGLFFGICKLGGRLGHHQLDDKQ